MTSSPLWYRSGEPSPVVPVSRRRQLRDLVRRSLPEPDVRARIMVMQSRTTMPSPSLRGFRTHDHGLFSEFHSVLGALHYARTHDAAGIRVEFQSPLYVDPARGPNWWPYFFDREVMRVDDGAGHPEEVRLNRVVTKYGRYGGFSDVVQGATPYFYPMTFGLDRHTLNQYVARFASVRSDVRARARQRANELFDAAAFVIGVHYRGTDAVHDRWSGVLRHYRTAAAPYAEFAAEIRRVLERAGPSRFQLFVASDETRFVEFMRGEFSGRVVALDAPRAGANGRAVHLDPAVPPAAKGESAVMDALLLAETRYLIKGRSNLSDASLIFNPDLPYSFYPDVSMWVGG
jgi:hypothetical protein